MIRFTSIFEAGNPIGRIENQRIVETCEGIARLKEFPRLLDLCCEACHGEHKQNHMHTVWLDGVTECFVCCQMENVLRLLGWTEPKSTRSNESEMTLPATSVSTAAK